MRLFNLAAMPPQSVKLGDKPPMQECGTSENPLCEAFLKRPIRLESDGEMRVPYWELKAIRKFSVNSQI